MRVIEGIIPPGGWHYIQSGKHWIEAASFSDLLDAVRNWRLQNGVDVGDVLTDVQTQICTEHPQQCHHNAPPAPGGTFQYQPSGQRFVDRIIEWALKMMGHPGIRSLETESEANRRAQICANCPLNTEWENSCPPCVEHAQRMMTIVRQNRDAQNYRKLHACAATNQCNRTAVWLKREVLQGSPSVSGECWLR